MMPKCGEHVGLPKKLRSAVESARRIKYLATYSLPRLAVP